MVSQKASLFIIGALALLAVAHASRAHNGFFQSLTEEQKEQVSDILHAEGSTKAEIKEKLRHWVSSQPKEVQEAFAAAEKAQESRRQRVQAKRVQLLTKVSKPAKDLDAKIKQIYEDQKLTKQQTCEKVRDLIKAATEQVKKELKLKEMSCDD